ncbi:TonB-dependent receptor [Rhodobacteraceae bacterium NNCM2]|nr:TonB-dependent receptor [Coraliihabitans acroporae]
MSVRAGLLSGVWVGASVIAAGSALSQEMIVLDKIRVESEAAQDTLGNMVITEEEIELRNPSTLKDVFDGESEISSSGGASIAQKVFVHGIEESLLSVTIDGARQNKSAFHHTGNVLLDPALLKAVNVSSGLSPADSGPGALAGLLAYETLDARDMLEPGQVIGGRATGSYQTNGEEFRGVGTVFGGAEGFEFLLNTTRSVGNDYEDGSNDTVPGTGTDLWAGAAKFAYTTETGHRFEVEGSYTRDQGERAMQLGPGGLYYARPDFAAVVGRESVYLDALSERTSVTFNYVDENPDEFLAPTAQLSYNEQHVEAGGAIGTNTSISGKLQNDFQLFSGVLSAGVDFFRDTAESGSPLRTGDPDETLSNVGLYAQMRQDVTDRVSLSYGARVDGQWFKLADGTAHSAAGVSANAAADVVIIEDLTLNAGVSTVWGGLELSEASLINLAEDWEYGEVDPSRSYNARIGPRYQIGPFTASAAYFFTQIENIDDTLSAARTDADLRSQGVDASLRFDSDTMFAQVNYTYADVTLSGETIPTTAYYYGRPVGNVFGLSAGWEPIEGATLGGTANFALGYNNIDDAGTDLDGYAVINLFASYQPPEFDYIELRFDVRNLLDQTYSLRTSDGVGSENIVALNEPGRSFMFTANVQF